MSARSAPSVEGLLEVIARYYPRWKRDDETLRYYLDRYQHSPEFVALQLHIAEAIKNDGRWRAFLADLRETFDDTPHTVEQGHAPSYTIPSFQVVVTIDGPGSTATHLVFRLSHLAPVYDFYESHRDRRGVHLTTLLRPTKDSLPVVETVERVISKHFDHVRLDARVGGIRLTDIAVEDILPGEATLADALFEDGRSW